MLSSGNAKMNIIGIVFALMKFSKEDTHCVKNHTNNYVAIGSKKEEHNLQWQKSNRT